MGILEVTRKAHFESIYENIIAELVNAKWNVKICVAWINAPMLRDTVAILKNNKIALEIVYDDNMSNLGLQQFQHARLYPVSMDGAAFMHNKFCIVDDEILITGSFNWTFNAAKSFENALIIKRDYRLIKEYLHEFEDLKMYSYLSRQRRGKRIIHPDGSRCRSLCYEVGVFGYAEGLEGKQEISVWSICNAHQIAECIKTIVVHDNPEDDHNDMSEYSDLEWYVSRERMLTEFELERKVIAAPNQFFMHQLESKVDAYGHVRVANEAEQIKFGCAPEYFLEFDWRHVYWRKIIPSRLFAEEGNIDDLLEKHKPGGSLDRW